jgi:hypothetical protein
MFMHIGGSGPADKLDTAVRKAINKVKEIRYPFHPLGGQRFQVLKASPIAGIDTLLLREFDRGSFSIAREWTGWDHTSPYCSLGLPPPRLDADSLFELAALVEQLTVAEQNG